MQVRRSASIDAPPNAPPVCREDLLAFMRSGCKTRDKWRIGTEHEKLGFDLRTKRRLNYDQIKALLEGLVNRFGWQPVMEGGNIIACKLDGQSVTLEPGGQFELSGAPLESLHLTCAEVNSHLYQVKTLAKDMGIGFMGVGFDPVWDLPDVPVMPKERYRIMRNYMPTKGSLGLDMMFRSTTIQVNLDFESEQDMIEKMRVGLALQPIATALFANSPFRNGKDSGYLSWRQHVWQDTDPDRCGNLPFVFDQDFTFERYVDYALNVPMYFIYRDGKLIEATGQTFGDFLEGRHKALPGERPNITDWENHLTTIFPDVRLKRFIEMRGSDGGPWRNICALPALWVGLLYDEQAQRDALDFIQDWTQEERDYLQREVPRTALKTPFRDGTVLDVAREVVQISRRGLMNRGRNEEVFLGSLEKTCKLGKCPAELLLERFDTEWGKSLDPLYSEMIY